MKRLSLAFAIFSLALAACGRASTNATDSVPAPSEPVLTVTDGSNINTYTLEDLQNMPTANASFKGVAYVGVPLSTLLEDAGYNLDEIKAVKASATDGFSANFEPELVLKPDTLVAFARLDGPLAGDEVPFRMVLPDQGGSLNVRMLIKLQVIH